MAYWKSKKKLHIFTQKVFFVGGRQVIATFNIACIQTRAMKNFIFAGQLDHGLLPQTKTFLIFYYILKASISQ